MISTATLFTRAWARRGAGPHKPHAANAATATATHGRHEIGGDPIGKPLNRRARPLRLGNHPDDLREQRLVADPLGLDGHRAVDADRRADDLVAGPLIHRDRLAGHHRLVQGARRRRSTTPSTGTFARAHAQPVAALHAIQAARPPRGHRERCEPCSAARLEQAAGWRRRCDAARGFEDLSEQHEHRDDDSRVEVRLDRTVRSGGCQERCRAQSSRRRCERTRPRCRYRSA